MPELYHDCNLPPQYFQRGVFDKLSGSAHKVYCLIRSRADARGITRMELAYIHKRCGISRVTMYAAFQELEESPLKFERIKPRAMIPEIKKLYKKLDKPQDHAWIFQT